MVVKYYMRNQLLKIFSNSFLKHFSVIYLAFISNLFLVVLILSQIFFIFKIYHYAGFILPISVLISIIMMKKLQFLKLENIKYFITIFFIFLCSLLIAHLTFDKAGDSRWYHQPIIFLLRDGWNPIYDYMKLDFLSKSYTDLLVHTYLKSNEILALAFILPFNDIQIGKAINILFMLYGFTGIYIILDLLFKLKTYYKLILALYIAFSPFFSAQYLSYYLDSNLLNCFTVALLCIILINSINNKLDNQLTSVFKLVLIMCLLYVATAKATGLVYTILLLSFDFILRFYRYFYLKENSFTFKKYILYIALLGCAIIFLGFHPYVENLLLGKHIFWPLMGHDSPINLSQFNGAAWTPFNKFGTFLLTYFLPYPATYSPFSFMFNLKAFVAADYSLCALGPFWGVQFICAIIIYIFVVIKILRGLKDNNLIVLCFTFTFILTSVFINPYFEYIRYVPQVYLLPFLAMLMLSLMNNKYLSKIYKIFLFMLVVDSGLFFGGHTILTVYRTYQLNKMENTCKRSHCILEMQNENIFIPTLVNQLKQDKVSYITGKCDNKIIIWADSLRDDQNNRVCIK